MGAECTCGSRVYLRELSVLVGAECTCESRVYLRERSVLVDLWELSAYG